MKLPKLTRKLIYTAATKGQSVEISWPLSAIEPKKGHKYTIQSGRAAGEDKIIVESTRELAGSWKVTVRLDSDPVRPLMISTRKAPEADPMGGPQFRAELEPEQVDARYQRLLSEEGRLKTVMHGALGRQRAAKLRAEQRLLDGHRPSKRSERAQQRHLKAKSGLDPAA